MPIEVQKHTEGRREYNTWIMQTKQIIAKSREVHSPIKIDIKCKQKAYFWEDIYLALWMKSLDQNQIAKRKIGGNIQNKT